MDIEQTIENLQTIKMWHKLLFKDGEETQRDIEVLTKISAMLITERDHEFALKRRFRRYGKVL